MTYQSFIIEEGAINTRLDKYLAQNITTLSRSKLKQIIEAGNVTINGKTVTDSSYQVKLADQLEITIVVNNNSSLEAKEIPLDIIFEDEDIIIINKQSGLTVHPGAGNHNDTLVNGLIHHCKGELSSIGDHTRPGIVHRLDKDTSGVMVVAKNNYAHMSLAEQLQERSMKRTYTAFVYGAISPTIGTIKTYYGRSKRDRTKMAVKRFGDKIAITHYRSIRSFAQDAITEMEFALETGRTHQIRVHMAHKRAPIIGDIVYGNGFNPNLKDLPLEVKKYVRSFPRQALHAKSLELTHPTTGEQMRFEAPIPEDMKELIAKITAKLL